jgi:hypothetical protein
VKVSLEPTITSQDNSQGTARINQNMPTPNRLNMPVLTDVSLSSATGQFSQLGKQNTDKSQD